MRKPIHYILLAGVMGCGQSDTASTTGQTSALPSTQTASNTLGLSPELAVKQAQDLAQKREAKAAIVLLDQAIQANPDLVEAYATRANILSEAQLYDQAVHDMDKAIRLKPDVAEFYNTRGYFCLLMENFGPAMEDFNRAIALDRNYAQPLNNRGLVLISLGGQFKLSGDIEKASTEFRKAVNEIDTALLIDDKYVDAHNNRGFALSLDKQYDEAVRSFTRAIELNDKYVNAWNNRGQAYAQTGQHELAVADFTKAIELQPTTLEYYQLRADAYLAAGKTDLARADLDHIEWYYELDAINRRLAANPKATVHWVERGNHLRKVARWDEALQNYRDALRVDPNCQPARIGQAFIQYQQGQLEAALAACQKILEAGPQREALSLRGDILNQQGHFQEAIADYEAAQRFDSKVAQAYLKRAELRKSQGEIQQASADIMQAIEMDPSLRKSLPDAPQAEIEEHVKPGAFPVGETEAKPIEPAASPVTETKTAEKSPSDIPAPTQPPASEQPAEPAAGGNP